MPTSGDLKSVDSLLTPHTPKFQSPPPPNKPQWEWLRAMYEVFHELHTIQIHDHQLNAKIIFVSD